MGDGNQLAGSEKMKTPSIRAHADLLERFDEWCEKNDTSRTEALREYMEEGVADGGHGEPDEWLPENDRDRNLYLAALDRSNDSLILSVRRERGRLAEKTKVAKSDVLARLKDLERAGYASLMAVWPGNPRADVSFRIKPRCAHPDEWVPGGAVRGETPETEGPA